MPNFNMLIDGFYCDLSEDVLKDVLYNLIFSVSSFFCLSGHVCVETSTTASASWAEAEEEEAGASDGPV